MNAPLPHSDKIVERSRLAVLFATLREAKRIVFTNGCFDILHPGHVDLLARCRALGDALVVGVNDDASVRRLNKIPPRPLNPLDHRMAVLAGLESVSFVTSFSEDTPLELITELKPHVLVKGGDWSLENIVGREVVQAHGGEVHSLPLLPGYSTTVLIEKILKLGK